MLTKIIKNSALYTCLGLALTLSACAFGAEKPYSKNWPALASHKSNSCLNFSGTYRFQGERPEGYYTRTCGQYFMQALFGDFYKPNYFRIRQFDCGELVVELPDKSVSQTCIRGNERCSFDGTMITAPTPSRSGVSSYSSGHIELLQDSSGSVVGKHYRQNVLHFVFIPFYYNNFYRWCRFERTTDP